MCDSVIFELKAGSKWEGHVVWHGDKRSFTLTAKHDMLVDDIELREIEHEAGFKRGIALILGARG